MIYRRLGRTALQASGLCLGTMNFGPRTDVPESLAILDAAIDLGINFIDTANQYGGNVGVGTSETIIGRWLAQDRTRQQLTSTAHVPDFGLDTNTLVALDAIFPPCGPAPEAYAW